MGSIEITVTGQVLANGGNSNILPFGGASGGGGGAGGGILLHGTNVTQNGLLSARAAMAGPVSKVVAAEVVAKFSFRIAVRACLFMAGQRL